MNNENELALTFFGCPYADLGAKQKAMLAQQVASGGPTSNAVAMPENLDYVNLLADLDFSATWLEMEVVMGNPADPDTLSVAAMHLRDAIALLRPLSADPDEADQ